MGRIKTITVASFLASLILVPATASANNSPDRQFSVKAGEPVSAALSLINAGDHAGALGKLSQALAISSLTPYERATIFQMQGSALFELERHSEAIVALNAARKTGGLNAAEQESLALQIAQLLIVNGEPAKGAKALETWAERGGTLEPRNLELLIQAWIETKAYDRALPWAEDWMNAADPKERKHYDLLNFLYNQTGDTDAQTNLVVQMILRWPDERKLWDSMASLLSNAGREIDALDINLEMYLRGFFTEEKDILKLVQYYGYHDIPYHGAKLMEKELGADRITKNAQNLATLADLWRQAREYERAIPVLQELAALSGDSQHYLKLGEALFHGHQCDDAEIAFRQAMDAGHNPSKAWMLIGSCRYEQAQEHPYLSCDWAPEEQRSAPRFVYKQKALKAFSKVSAGTQQHRDARKWSSFITAENEAFQTRCEFEAQMEIDACNLDIQRAYDAFVLTNEFTLSDASCMQYKPAFDEEYRKGFSPTSH